MARITLERPARINALTLAMVDSMALALETWAHDDGVSFVVIDGAGERGFCAGGDLRALYDSARTGDEYAATFWAHEYRLNALVASYPKPIVALMPGIVMGGGVGIGAHARLRVVTETTRLAMPEAAIGLIPDVGATRLLARMPGHIGTYLGLTGEAIGAADAIALGLADYYVPSHAYRALIAALAAFATTRTGDASLRTTIEAFARAPAPELLPKLVSSIDRSFGQPDVATILRELARDGSAFACAARERIVANSPTSVCVTLRALQEARRSDDLLDCLRREYRVMMRLGREADFCEGVRAAVIDRDRRPRWNPGSIGDIDAASIERYFESLEEGELHIR